MGAFTACGDDAIDPESDPPTWTDAPTEAISVGQGQTRSVPVTFEDPQGDEVTVTASTQSAGIDAEVVTEGDTTRLLVHANYDAASPASVDVVLSDGNEDTTVTVSLEVTPIRWVAEQEWSEPDGPEAREHGSVIVDADGAQAFLFGGSGYSPYLEPFNDAWRYDIASGAWTSITPSGDVPDPGGSRRVAQIPGTNVAYLFGGYGGTNGGTNFNDLHRVTMDGGELVFTEITQNNPPSRRALHAFAYDPGTERFVVFGGAGSALHDDTWIMTLDGDTANWTELTTEVAPSARYGFFAGMDVELGRLVIFSGAQGGNPINPAQDTWVLDMRAEPPTWELLLEGPDSGVPPGRRNGCAVFDPTGPRLFVFGGTADAMTTEPGLFVFDARPGKAAWKELALEAEPPVRSSGFGFYDAVGGRTLLGFGNTSSSVFTDWNMIGY
jgi:hypothetical protein